MNSEILQNDLKNRFRSFRFRTRKVGSLIELTIRRYGTILYSKKSSSLESLYFDARQKFVGQPHIDLLSTSSQRNRLKNIEDGQTIFNITDNKLETYYKGTWY